jgi:cation:H+ antiporter
VEAILPLLTSLGLLITIVWACTIFTNAIEWMGHRFKLSDGAVGSVLAAVGTALPETMVPIIALVSGAFGLGNLGHESSQEIGIGAILGAPFLLSTLAMGVMAIATLIFAAKRGPQLYLKARYVLVPSGFTVLFARLHRGVFSGVYRSAVG